MEKPDNGIRVPSSLSKNFFKYWLLFLKPFHKLTDREIDVVAGFLKYRHELSKDIKNEELLDKVIMNDDIKKKVMEECNIKLSYFQVIMGRLKQGKIMINGRINPKFIPHIRENSDHCTLLLYFEL